MDDFAKIPIGISSCLLGQQVRYDGGDRFDPYINGTLAEHFQFVPFCPEVEVGLGVPRPPIQLQLQGEVIRVVGVDNRAVDVTEVLHAYGKKVADESESLCGYIFKARSPSCGMAGVRVYDEQGQVTASASGAYAYSLINKLPLLPVEDEVRLGDPELRENFIVRIFAYHRAQQMKQAGLTPQGLQAFHAEHKYLVMAHDQAAYKRMGRMLAEVSADNVKVLFCLYLEELMLAIRHPASRGGHVNVMQHLMGYLKQQLDSESKAELLELFEQYEEGLVPLSVPHTLLRHHFRLHPHDYIARQHYLYPHPHELMLRNTL